MALVLLGIPNCNTVKKARVFLEKNEIEYKFRDLRKEELTKEEWERIVKQDKDNLLINTKGPSFRKLGVDKSELVSEKVKLKVLLECPTAMKRPLVLSKNKIKSIGFNEDLFSELYL